MNEHVLKNHFMYRKKTLATQPSLTHFDIWFEIILRVLTIPLFVEVVSYLSNTYHDRAYEYRPIRFWSIVILFLIISPIQLYVLMWKLRKEKAI